MRRRPRLLAAAIAVLAAASAANAQSLFSNLGPCDTFDPVQFTALGSFGEQTLAIRFIPTASAFVQFVDVPLSSNSGGPPVSVRMEIRTDASGLPSGIVLTSRARTDISAASLYTFAMDATPLNGSQAYWLVGVVTPGTSARWLVTNPPVSTPMAVRNIGNGPNFVPLSASSAVAARIRGTFGLGACCSPVNGGCTLLQQAECTTLGLTFVSHTACAPSPCAPPCPVDFNRSGNVSVQDLFDFLEAFFAGC